MVKEITPATDETNAEAQVPTLSAAPAVAPTGPDSTGPDSTGPDSTGPDSTEPDSTGPDSTGPDSTEPVATDSTTDTDFSVAAPPEEEPEQSFDDWNLTEPLRRSLHEMGYERPMRVQSAVFRILSEGRDLMVQSRTGSGKTAAFGIPIAQNLSDGKKGVQSLILAPTRELAMQVGREIQKIATHMDLAVVQIYGGAPIGPQISAIEAGAQIVAGTPGRVLDHIRRGTLKTSGIRMLVLDECDEMLSMGFQEEIENIIATLPPKEDRQTLLFSATIPKEIERIGRRHLQNPEMISLSSDSVGVDLISHYYYVVTGMARTRDLLKLMKAEQPDSAIIFCNTREETTTVARYLRRHDYDAEALSSDLSQKDRERVMGRMRDKNLNFLVATDIAARGIDISDLSHVINFTFPASPEVYVHRSGRTGRAGKDGTALSLVGPREIGAFYYLKLIYKIIPEERELPTASEMATIDEGEQYQQVIAMVEDSPKAEFVRLGQRLWQSDEGARVVGALLERLLTTKKVKASSAPAATVTSIVSDTIVASNDSDAQSVAPTTDGGPAPRRKRRRRGARDEAATVELVEAADAAVVRTAPTEEVPEASPIVAEAVEDTEAVEAVEATEATEVEDRPRRRRRRRGAPQEDAAVSDIAAEATVQEATTEATVQEADAPQSAIETETEDSMAACDEATDEPTVEPEATDEPTESKLDTLSEDAEDDKPRKRRRRRRGSGKDAQEEVTETTSTTPEEVESKSSRSAKSKAKARKRTPKTSPGIHTEFWEAWADEKTGEPDDAQDAQAPSDEETPVTTPDEADQATTVDATVEPQATSEAAPRKKRRRRGSRDAEPAEPVSEDETRLFINIGKREDATADDIRAFLAEALGDDDAGILGKITLRNTHCYLLVPNEEADRVIEACTSLQYKERDLVVERAKR